MSKIKIRAAVGNAPELALLVNTLTDLDSVDSNRVHVVARTALVTITSFGPGTLVEKRVRFDANIKIHHNPPNLILLSGSDRTANAGDVGKYYADSNGVWREEEWNPAPYKQTILVAASLKVICPVGFTKAFIQLCGPGGATDTFLGSGHHYGSNGGYCEKTVQAVPGQWATLTVGVTGASPTSSRFFQYAGASPPPPYPDTWAMGDMQAGVGGSWTGALAPTGGAASGGDVNVTGAVGSYNSGTNTASMPAGGMCAAQSINSGHATGASYGGGGLAVDAAAGPGGPAACWITWGR